MLIFLAILNDIVGLYWSSLRKNLGERGIAPLTITHAPNFFGHPIGIFVLLILGAFVLPKDPRFFLYWFLLVGISTVSSTLSIRGLTQTKFFGAQMVSRMAFAVNMLFAVLFLGEHLDGVQIFAIIAAFAGVMFFAWPERVEGSLRFDRGLLLIFGSIIVGGLAWVAYKFATVHAESYYSFLSGRFVGDLIAWTIAWLISLKLMKRSPEAELKSLFGNRTGFVMAIGVAVSTLVDSWLIYNLPLSTLAIVGTVAFPASYLLSKLKYKEKITLRMWAGASLIVASVILFLTR